MPDPPFSPAAAAWIDANYHVLLSAAREVLPNPQDAEDAAQDAALRILSKWHLFREGDDARRTAWCYTVAKRVAIDLHRKNARRYVESLAGQAIVEDRATVAPDVADTVIDRLALQERLAVLGDDEGWFEDEDEDDERAAA